MNNQKQLRLPFETPRETKAERCQRLLSDIPKLQTAAQMFDAQAYREATAAATTPFLPKRWQDAEDVSANLAAVDCLGRRPAAPRLPSASCDDRRA